MSEFGGWLQMAIYFWLVTIGAIAISLGLGIGYLIWG